ncbi:helicase-related protein [Robertmurraya massiliosenegalensis]|uniref:helicase-related protein n=1 Tax=Robertmurraya massiliosenegalensis TaxID=1287657 RepID=UPI0003009D5B|nr:helicase-related protein [Robertmurraya massiliosenegalensis]
MAKKIRVTEDGKQFEAFLKVAMTTTNDKNEKTLIGVALAGSLTSCRAVHAALYQPYVEIFDDRTGKVEKIRSSQSFRRIEEVNGKVCHMFAMPRMAVGEDYQDAVLQNSKTDNQAMPERVIMTWEQDIYEVAGHFLAETFGLPRNKEWTKHYLSILPLDKLQKVDVETTNIAGELQNIKAFVIKSMKEEEMLAYVQDGIQMGYLPTKQKGMAINATFKENWSTEDYLRANANLLFAKIDTFMKPKYDGSHYSKYIAETNRICVPAQARSVMGLLGVLKEKIGAFLVAGMGTGKTQMSLTTAYIKARQREESGAKDGFRALIVAPSNVLPKWATSEIPTALGTTCIVDSSQLSKIDDFQQSRNRKEYKLWTEYKKAKNIITVLNSSEDALAYIQLIKLGWRIPKGKMHFILVSTDRMKLHSFGFVLGAKWNPYHFHWVSPETGKPLQSPREKIEDRKAGILAGWSDVVEKPSNPPTMAEIQEARKKGMLDTHGLPIGYVKKWKPEVRSFQDNYENEKSNRNLARPALKKFGESKYGNRWMIAQLFQRMLPKHFHMGIFDEIHQMKAQGSGRGMAFHKILKACRKSLFLTGTLTNGASSSIQAVLWRVFPKELLDLGFTHKTTVETWAQRYGVLEKVKKINDDNLRVGVTTNQKKNDVIIKEKPGISPDLVANHLLDKSVFMDVSELQVPMITLEEKPIVVTLDDDHFDEYRKFHTSMYNACQALQKDLGTAAWSKFTPSVLNYADQPTLGMSVEFKDKDGATLKHITAPAFPPSYETAKERKLIELVLQRIAQNRRVIIYTNFTQEYRTNQRLQKVLKNNGVDSVILDGKVSVDARFEWLEQQEQKGTRVIITNQRLVEVGLDLLAFPTIIFWQMNDDINTVRQAAKRSHRLGQHKHCEVLFLVNDKTQQMAQFQRLMSRRVSALLVEGAIERSDALAKYADVSAGALTNDLSKMLESSEIANAWEQAAQKDIDSNLQMVTEEEFQQKITEAFTNLTQETKNLCGYVEPVKDTLNDELEALFNSVDDFELDSVFANFDKITDEDLAALEAFESTQPKEQKDEVPKVEMKDIPSKKSKRSSKDDAYEGLSLFDFAV